MHNFRTTRKYKSQLSQHMFLFRLWRYNHTSFLNNTRVLKVVLLIASISVIIVIRVILLLTYNNISSNESIVKNVIENVAEDIINIEDYRKKGRILKDLKYILLWSHRKYDDTYINLGKGQHTFISNKCSSINCYVTPNKHFFGDNLTKFDAILFNGVYINSKTKYNIPYTRAPHQKYIYFNKESSDYYPVCNSIFDGFFNWTATYKLNSDILFTYVQIRNRSGDIIGPKKNMEWTKNISSNNDLSIVENKSKAVAWLVSHCNASSGRDKFVTQLEKYLRRYDLTLDIYGKCGPYRCSLKIMDTCLKILGRKYYFYLALENSFSEDYVTEKLLTALNHNMVPIVYGGADYSRFLPQNTYLDALQIGPRELAGIIAQSMISPEQYVKYFWWKSHYTYLKTPDGACALCAALNNKTMMETRTVYDNFRIWWNPLYKIPCQFT